LNWISQNPENKGQESQDPENKEVVRECRLSVAKTLLGDLIFPEFSLGCEEMA
jgi:hypothetical protein